jgi:hypothetical protein
MIPHWLRKRWLWICIATYLGLWALTYFVGAPQARQLALDRHMVPRHVPKWTEVPRDGLYPEWSAGPPKYSCQAVSYAPFLITVRFAVTLDDEGGSGETVIHAWFGRPSHRFLSLYQWNI